ELINGKIVGLGLGGGTKEIAELMIEDYELNYEILTRYEGEIIEALKETVKKEEPIMIHILQQQDIFSEVDLKFLDDRKKSFGEVEEISLATREDFVDDYPEVYEWMSNWSIDDDETMGELINFVNDNDDPLEGAKEWVEENRDLTDEWVK